MCVCLVVYTVCAGVCVCGGDLVGVCVSLCEIVSVCVYV